MLRTRKNKCKMSAVLVQVLQASSQLWYSIITEGPNTELNPLSHTHRNSPECWKMKKKCKMSPMFELVLQASSQLWNPFVTEGSITELNPLSHRHRNSTKCWEMKNQMQNGPSIGAVASSIQPTLVPPRYRGPQH
jgi:hypothetical protein